jgi:cyanophycinase
MLKITSPSLSWRLLGASLLLGLGAACSGAESIPGPQDWGTLVIAGGAVSSDNHAVYGAFLGAMPRGSEGQIAVITAASASPVGSAQRFSETLARYGVPESRVSHVHLAVIDDESTDGVDERQWADNAFDPGEIGKIEVADAIWFAGGDQLRLTQTLLDGEGAPTPMLTVIRERLARGAVIGGTSAGAAIMSDPMIARGESMSVLLDDSSVGELLRISPGLGFFEHGLVDQHFDTGARLGRVAVALQRLEPERRVGFGVDEDSALVYRVGGDTLTVAGLGNVTILDGRHASWDNDGDGFEIQGLSVSVLSPGDHLTVVSLTIHPSSYLASTVGDEYEASSPVRGGGMAMPAYTLSRMLGKELLDNAGATSLDRFSFVLTGDVGTAAEFQGRGVRYRFTQTSQSKGFWGYDPAGQSRYSLAQVRLDIEPFDLELDPEGLDGR